MNHQPPERVFLDTNVFLIGALDPDSPEAILLHWAGFDQEEPGPVEIIVSDELFEQISRVAKRLKGKDWGAQIIGRAWQHLQVNFILLDDKAWHEIAATGVIPREDIGVYLTARLGMAQCFVSNNRELIQEIAKQRGEFECLTPQDFVAKYLPKSGQ